MPAKKTQALSAAQVRTRKVPGVHADGNGLTLRVSESGTKRWVRRVTIGGKQWNIGLGSYPSVSLADARETAIANLWAIRQGCDPIADKPHCR